MIDTYSSQVAVKIITALTNIDIFSKLADITAGNSELVKSILEKNIFINKVYLQEINENAVLETNKNLVDKDSVEKIVIKQDSIISPFYKKYGKVNTVVGELPFGISVIPYKKEEFIYSNKITKTEYAFIQRGIESLVDDGKAIFVVPMGVLFSSLETDIRKKMIEEDIIESIITFGDKSLYFPETAINVAIVVFNKNKLNKGKVQFINAESLIKIENKKNYITDSSLKKLVEIYTMFKENENCYGNEEINKILDSKEIISEFDTNLDIWKKLKGKELLNKINGVSLGMEFVVKRGIQITPIAIEKVRTNDTEQGYYCLNKASLKDGTIEFIDENRYVNANEDWIDKAEAKPNDLIISLTGDTKLALYENNMKKTLVLGDFMIIRPKNEYSTLILKTYFESKIGKELLKYAKTGSTISMFNIKELEKVIIPKLDIKSQKEIINKIKLSNENYINEKNKIEEKREKELNNIYESMCMEESYEQRSNSKN